MTGAKLAVMTTVRCDDGLSTLRAMRRDYGLSRGLAGMLLGVTERCVRSWECGRSRPTGAASRLIMLLDALLRGRRITSVAELLGWRTPTEAPLEAKQPRKRHRRPSQKQDNSLFDSGLGI